MTFAVNNTMASDSDSEWSSLSEISYIEDPLSSEGGELLSEQEASSEEDDDVNISGNVRPYR